VFKQYETLLKSKTVADYYAKGGRTNTLAKCISKKWCKLA
jgi:hypothetical protein